MPPPIINAFESVPPPTTDASDPVPHPEGEAVAGAKPEAFGGDPVDLSLLHMYPDHVAKHILDKEVTLIIFIIFYYVNFK